MTCAPSAISLGPRITAGGTLLYTEGDPATAIDPALTITDPNSTNLTGAGIRITSNYQNGEDVLSFTNTPTLTGIFTPATGTLTLAGTDSVANYQSALRSVQYQNTSVAPKTANRTVSWNATDGTTASNPATSTITVTAVNNAPSFIAGPNQTVLEDAGPQTVNPWATAISDGDGNTQALTFNITGNTNPTLFSAGPAISPTGVLTYTPAANANGTATVTLVLQDNGGTANGGVDTSPSQTFAITVNPVNDAPLLDLDANDSGGVPGADFAATFTEGGAARLIEDPVDATVSDLDSATLTALTVTLTNLLDTGVEVLDADNTVVGTTAITEQPFDTTTVPGTGILTLSGPDTLANYQAVLRTLNYDNTSQNPNPTARNITFVASDGVNNSNTATSTVTVISINSAPSFTVGPDPTVDEDAGPQTVDPWATAISDGDGNTQTLTFNITGNTDPTLFSAVPAISATGVLTYTPAPNANGAATITLTLSDNGSNTPPNVNTSASQSFIITVNAVNDAPTFTAADPPAVPEDAGAQTVPSWATFNPGNPQESAQTVLAYTVSGVSNAALFTVGGQPSIDTSGNLTYTPAPGINGISTFDVAVQDNGGTANGGVDMSASQTFTITVNAVDNPPVAVNDTATVAEDALPTAIPVLANDTDSDGGPISITAVTQPANGAVVITGGGTGLTYQPNADYCNSPPGTTLDTFTYTLTPGGSTATVTVTVTCADDPPVAVDDAAAVNEDSGANALSVLANDTDVDGGPISITAVTQPANGAVVITGGGTGLTYQPNADYCNSPPATTQDTFTYTLTLGGSTATVTVTVTCANDAPVIALPGAADFYDPTTAISVVLDATATVTDVDSPDFDTGILTADVTTNCENNDRLDVRNQGTGVGQISVSGATVNYNFGSGPIAIGTIATEFDCATPAVPSLTVTLNASATPTATRDLLRNVTFFSNSPTPVGTSRNVNMFLTDGDGGTSNTATKAVSIDAPPKVNAITPANNATGVALTDNVVITFSEAVNVSGNWFQIACPTSGNRDALTGVSVSAGPTVYTINPNADFANAEVCAVTVTAAQVADQDIIDPPDNMAADFTSTFTTVDTAPRVTSAIPAAAATVANNQAVTLNFSEGVDLAAGGITWNCGGAVTFTPALPQSNVTTLTLTPTGALTNGAACTVTLESTLITDSDAIDPPDQLDGDSSGDIIENDADDFTRSFTVDVPPTLNSSTPANGDSNVSVSGNIALTFSEAVDVTTSSFAINCGSGNLAYGLSGSGSSAVTLNPSADLLGATTCTVSVSGGNVSDSDGIDPPDTMTSSPSFSFTTQAIAVDDSYTATPHLTLAVDTGIQSGRVTANDQLGGIGSIFGFGACSGTAPGAQLDAGVANGRLTLNLNGSFSYEPPASVANTTRTFCYTVTGGDTANIAFSLQNTELVWFVDAAAGAGGIGTQARPFTLLTDAAAVDTVNDFLFVADGNYTCGITLANNEDVIGDGSTQALSAFTTITPVAGSAFPALAGTAPVFTTASGSCVTLDATAGNSHRLRGFIIGDTGTGTDIAGTNFGTLTVAEVLLNGTGQALNLNTGTLTGTFSGVTSTSGTNNLNLITVGGTSNFGSGAVSGASGTAFNVSGSNATISYAGTISKSSAGRLVDIQSRTGGSVTLSGNLSSTGTSTGINVSNNTGGTHTFSGTTKTLSTGAIAAVTLATNAGATINFSGGGLVITTTSGTGFNATGGAAAINVTGSGNTITSTTGTALNVVSTTIGASGLNFQSISANGAANGIVLDNTGSGGLTVTGNSAGSCGGGVSSPTPPATVVAPSPADCTGGSILASTNAGVLLTNTRNVSLTRMRIANGADDGIRGDRVNGFTLASSLVESNGAVVSPTFFNNLDFGDDRTGGYLSGFVGLTGTVSITNSTIRNGSNNNILIRNKDTVGGTLNLTMTGSVISGNPANGFMNDGVLMESGEIANMNATITGNIFTASKGDHFQIAALNSGDANVTLSNNTLTGGHATALGQGITINAATGVPGWNGRIDYDVNGNHINGAISNGVSIVLGTSSAAAVFDGFVRNNVIGTSGSSQSCSTQANGVYIDARGNGTHNSSVTGNTIRQCFDRGILSEAGDGDSVLNLTVQSNLIDQQVDVGAREAIQTNYGITSTNVFSNVDTNLVCLQLGGAGALANTFSHGGGAPDDFRLRKRFEATVRLPGYGGGTGQTPGHLGQVVAFIQGQNTGSAGEPGSASASGTGGGYTGGAACPLPL